MCVLSINVPIRKKSGNLSYAPRIYIYIYTHTHKRILNMYSSTNKNVFFIIKNQNPIGLKGVESKSKFSKCDYILMVIIFKIFFLSSI